MNKITKREQFMLFILGMILIFVLFYVVVWTPSQTQKLQSESLRSELEAQKSVMDTTLPLYNKLETDLEEKLITIETELDQIEDNLSASRFERWMFDLFKDADVTVTNATMGQPAVASPDASLYVKNDPMYNIKSMINEINGITMSQAVEPATQSQLMKSTYTYTFEADYITYADILDDITGWNTTFFVNSSNYDFIAETGTITIDTYTIDKFEVPEDAPYEPYYPSEGLNDASDVKGSSGTGTGTGTGNSSGNGNSNGNGTDLGVGTDTDKDGNVIDDDDGHLPHFPGDSGKNK